MVLLHFPLVLGLITHSAVAMVIRNLDAVVSQPFDFIVVGGQLFWSDCIRPLLTFSEIPGGAGGSVIANRLTENPDVSVLLVEAGGS